MSLRAKNVLCGAALALLCLLLAACVDVQLRFDVRADGSGSAEYAVEIPKDGAASLGLTAEKVKAEMLKDRQFQRPGVKTSIGRAANGNQTVTVSMPFTSVQELSSGDLGFEFQKTPDGRQCTLRIHARGAEVVPVRAQAEVRMPGRITRSNADQVNGNVARFNSIFRADGLWVQSETGAFLSSTMLAAVLGGAAAIMVILLLLVRMNKKRAGTSHRGARAAGAVYCRQCATDNKPGAKFCRSCGAPLAVASAAAAPSPASASAASRCPRCGKELTPDKKFCPVCGTPVAAAAAPAAALPPPPLPLRTTPAPQPAPSSVMMIALGASLVLLLLAIVLLVYRLYFQNRAAAPPAAPAQAASTFQPAPEAPAAPVTAEPQAGVRTQPVQVKAAEVPAAVREPGRPSPMPQAQPQTTPPAPPPGSQPQPSSSSAPPEQPAADSQPALAPPAPAASAYSGPRSGVIVWSGQLERDGLIEISGEVASSGALRGNLPGVPVIVEIQPPDVGVAEAPSPQNGWKRLVLRSRSRRLSVVTIKWSVIQ